MFKNISSSAFGKLIGSISSLPTFPSGGGGGYSNYTTLDPTKANATITLSNGNLTFVGLSNWGQADAVKSAVTGKFYYEMTVDVAGQVMLGMFKTGATMALFVGQTTDGFSMGQDGTVRTGNNGSGLTFGLGDVVSCAIDVDAGYIWYAVNGVWAGGASQGNPVAGTNPTQIITGAPIEMEPAVSAYPPAGGTVNFGASGFHNSNEYLPAGFQPWAD